MKNEKFFFHFYYCCCCRLTIFIRFQSVGKRIADYNLLIGKTQKFQNIVEWKVANRSVCFFFVSWMFSHFLYFSPFRMCAVCTVQLHRKFYSIAFISLELTCRWFFTSLFVWFARYSSIFPALLRFYHTKSVYRWHRSCTYTIQSIHGVQYKVNKLIEMVANHSYT